MNGANPPSLALVSSTRWCSRGSATSSSSRARSWTASSTASTGRRISARRWTSPSIAATCRATTSGAWTGGCTRAPIATTSRSTKRTRTPTSPCCWTSRSRWDSAAAASRSSNTRRCWPAVSPTWCTASATASGSWRSTTTSSSTCRRRRSTWTSCCTCSIGCTPANPGNLRAPLHKMAEHFGRRGLLVLISDLYEEPDAVLEAIGPLRFRGNDLAVFHLLDPAELDFSFSEPSAFEDLESGDQIPIVPDALAEQYQAAGPGARRRAAGTVLSQSHRLHAGQHVVAARPRVVQLPDRPGRRLTSGTRDGIDSYMAFSDAALPRSACGPRHSGAAPPDSERAKERRPLSVADVPAADSVPVRSAPSHPSLAAADDAACGARADRARVRAAVLPADRIAAGAVGGARSRRPARSFVQHGLRRQVEARDGVGAAGGQRSDGLGPRIDRALLGEPEVALRSTADRSRLLAALAGVEPGAGATRYGPALKLAGSILGESALPRREAILITRLSAHRLAGRRRRSAA